MNNVRYVVFVEGKGYVYAEPYEDYNDVLKLGIPTFVENPGDFTYFRDAADAYEYVKHHIIFDHPNVQILGVSVRMDIIAPLTYIPIAELYGSEMHTFFIQSEMYEALKAKYDLMSPQEVEQVNPIDWAHYINLRNSCKEGYEKLKRLKLLS